MRVGLSGGLLRIPSNRSGANLVDNSDFCKTDVLISLNRHRRLPFKLAIGVLEGSLALVLALAPQTAGAGSPTMATAVGSSALCGGPEDVCSPGADIFTGGLTPPAVVSGLLGLLAGDEITGLSYGLDSLSGSAQIAFSVDAASSGSPGGIPDVFSEAASAEAYGDIFDGGTISAPTPNSLIADGDGTIAAPAGAFTALGLREAPSGGALDELSALSSCDPEQTLGGGGAVLTLAPGSPTLTALGAGPADVLLSSGGSLSILASAASLGLTVGDEIDALVAAGFSIAFSLVPGSPTLGVIGAGPADIIRAGSPPTILVPAAFLGLTSGDNIDALDVAPDLDGDLVNDGCDNCSLIANNDQNNQDGDTAGDACDSCTDSDADGFGDPGFLSNTCPDDNCPFDGNPGQADGDVDGAGDACDVCTNIGGLQDFDFKPKVVLKKVNTDVTIGNDRIQIKGSFTLAGATNFANLDPAANGFRVVMRLAGGALSFDSTLPSGAFGGNGTAGWRLNGSGTAWKFADKTGTPVNGIVKVKIKNESNKSANRVRVSVKGKEGNYPFSSGNEPPFVTLVLGDQTSANVGECTESIFVVSDCRYNGNGDKLQCKRK